MQELNEWRQRLTNALGALKREGVKLDVTHQYAVPEFFVTYQGLNDRELQETRTALRTKVSIREEGKTRLESLIEQSRSAPFPGAELPDDAKLPESVVFRDASARDIYSAIGKFTNISVVFDPAFRDQPVSIDLRNETLADALNKLSGATRNFWRSTGNSTVSSSPDSIATARSMAFSNWRTLPGHG